LNGTRVFKFSLNESIPSSIASSLECQFETGVIFKAFYLSSTEFECGVTSNQHQNLTFWFRNELGIRSKLSLNFITLYFLQFGEISFATNSSRFGITNIVHKPIVKFINAEIPKEFNNQVFCNFEGANVETIPQNETNTFSCSLSSTVGGYKSLGISFSQMNSYKIVDVHNTFVSYLNLTFSTPSILSTNLFLRLNLDTQALISKGIVKNNCDDILVTFKGIQIERLISQCNTFSTLISFKVQESQVGVITDYDIYYGNKDAVAKQIQSTGTTYSLVPSYTSPQTNSLVLNSNTLEFGFLKKFSISKIDPLAALVNSSSVNLWTDYISIDYKNQIKFEMRDVLNSYQANFTNGSFSSIIQSQNAKKMNISLWVKFIPSGEFVEASLNQIEFIFVEKITLNSLYPFVDRFNSSTQNKTVMVTIQTQSTFITNLGLNCMYTHNGVSKFTPAIVLENSNTLNCTIDAVHLNISTEIITFQLFMNVSQNQNFILSFNNVTYVFLKEPIQMEIPTVITAQYFYTNFSLMFENTLRNSKYHSSIDDYKVAMKPEFMDNPTSNLNCDFNKLTPTCQINSLSLTYTPMRLDYEMTVFGKDPLGRNVSESFKLISNYFRENVSFIYEHPFLIDANRNTKVNVTFKVDKNLHPNYSFYCQESISRIQPIKKVIGTLNTFTCEFLTRGREEILYVSLVLNNTSIKGLDETVSTNVTTLEVVSLKFIPEFTTTPALNITISKNGSLPLVIPRKYQNYEFILQFQGDGSINCIVDSNLHLICLKPQTGLTAIDIRLFNAELNYKIGSNFELLVSVHDPLIYYKTSEIKTIFPSASLVGSSTNITLTFESNTTYAPNITDIEYYCEFLNGSSSNRAIRRDNSVIECLVPYGQSNILNFKSFFKVPSISGNKKIYTTLNESLTKFHYLTPKDISFSDTNQIQFYFSSTLVSLKVNVTSFIPLELTKYFKTRLMDYSDSTNLTWNDGNSFQFESQFLTSSFGKKQLSLWYKENSHEFQFSNNTLEIVFVVPSLINGIFPTAIIINRTTSMTVSTLFQTTVDYGLDTNFTCKYGMNESRYSQSSQAQIDVNGNFFCDVTFRQQVKIYISVWMKVKGTERKITILDESLLVIDSNFLTPSFGLSSGNEFVKINEYTAFDSNVTFQDSLLASKYQFNCKKTISTLDCYSPSLLTSDAPLFQSYPLSFTSFQKNLSIPWIIYQKREISDFYPKFAPSTSLSFLLNLTFNDEIKIKEGSLFLIFSPETNDRKDFNLGKVQSSNISNEISFLSSERDGTFNFQLFYQNPFSIEFRSMFAISQKNNVTFVGKSQISFLFGQSNIFYVNETSNVTIQFNDDSKLHLRNELSSIRCKLGSNFVTTIPKSSNEFVCVFNSTEAKLETLSMYFVNPNALGNEILISTNSLGIIFFSILFLLTFKRFNQYSIHHSFCKSCFI
jgi:hypothetical protein